MPKSNLLWKVFFCLWKQSNCLPRLEQQHIFLLLSCEYSWRHHMFELHRSAIYRFERSRSTFVLIRFSFYFARNFSCLEISTARLGGAGHLGELMSVRATATTRARSGGASHYSLSEGLMDILLLLTSHCCEDIIFVGCPACLKFAMYWWARTVHVLCERCLSFVGAPLIVWDALLRGTSILWELISFGGATLFLHGVASLPKRFYVKAAVRF